MNIVFGSVEQMISSAGLSGLMGATINTVTRTPLDVAHFSGNLLERVSGLCDGRPISFVLKRFSREQDWVMRLTHDAAVREVALYRVGTYADLPVGAWQPTLAAAPDGNSWAALMEDITDWLTSPESVSDPILHAHLQHLAEIHAHFMSDSSLQDSELGLSSLEDFVTIFTPDTIQRELAGSNPAQVFKLAAQGWQAFEQLALPEAVSVVQRVQSNPSRLLEALQAMPATLVHGDYKLANLGYRPGLPEPRTIVLDWQDASYGPGLLDLAYWMAVNPHAFPGNKKDAALAFYRNALAGLGISVNDEVWAHDVALCLLAGGGLRLFWQMALRAQKAQGQSASALDELRWWSEKVIQAGRWLQ